jgi:hypothetical protein
MQHLNLHISPVIQFTLTLSSSLKLTKPAVAACRFKVVSLPLPVHFHQSLRNPAPSLFHPTLRVNPDTIQRLQGITNEKGFSSCLSTGRDYEQKMETPPG